MSIAALLSHHGVTIPRYVTVSGRVVFGDVQPSKSGYLHSEFGSVTPIANHTFHGGIEGPDRANCEEQAWWHDAERLLRHTRAMEQAFPSFSYLESPGDRAPSWYGEINTGRGTFKVLIAMRPDEALPSVRVMGAKLGVHAGRRWIRAPHLYVNGNICVADEGEWHPEEHTAATVTAWAAHWLAAYTEWRVTRRWPVEGVQAHVA